MVHFLAIYLRARYNNLSTDSSFGNEPLVLRTFRRGVPHQMDNAQLHLSLGIDRFNSIGEASQTIDTGNKDVLEPPVFEFCEDA